MRLWQCLNIYKIHLIPQRNNYKLFNTKFNEFKEKIIMKERDRKKINSSIIQELQCRNINEI